MERRAKNPKPRQQAESSKAKANRSRQGHARIAEIAIAQFTGNRSAFWSASPELANAIEQYLKSRTRPPRGSGMFEGYMTDRERQFKLGVLSEIIERYRAEGKLSIEDGKAALEHASALREHSAPFKDTLVNIAERVFDVHLNSMRPQKITLERGKSKHHTYELVRGLTLSLTWDGALIEVQVDPDEYQRRRQAMSFVGSAEDVRPDVAANHDMYVWAQDGR